MPRASSRWLFFAANLLHKKNHVVPCSFCRHRTRSQLNFPRPAVIVKILSMFLANAKANVIKITYEGVLKSADVVYGDNGNLNTATLFVLPNDSVTKAQVDDPSEAKAVTCSGELFKYTTENGAKKPLADAEFEVARDGAKLEFYCNSCGRHDHHPRPGRRQLYRSAQDRGIGTGAPSADGVSRKRSHEE